MNKLIKLMDLAAMSESEWLAQCSPQSIPGADVDRALRKGDKALELLGSEGCDPDPALVAEWAKDFGGKHDR